jgi:hypothetical protein
MAGLALAAAGPVRAEPAHFHNPTAEMVYLRPLRAGSTSNGVFEAILHGPDQAPDPGLGWVQVDFGCPVEGRLRFLEVPPGSVLTLRLGRPALDPVTARFGVYLRPGGGQGQPFQEGAPVGSGTFTLQAGPGEAGPAPAAAGELRVTQVDFANEGKRSFTLTHGPGGVVLLQEREGPASHPGPGAAAPEGWRPPCPIL